MQQPTSLIGILCGVVILLGCATPPVKAVFNLTPMPLPTATPSNQNPGTATPMPVPTVSASPKTESTSTSVPVGHKETVIIAQNMTFNGTVPGPTLRFKKNEKVLIQFINKDQLEHDWMLVPENEQAPYLVPAFSDAKSKLLAPNAQVKIEFIPTQAGTYKYICTVPGHEASMYGLLLVEE